MHALTLRNEVHALTLEVVKLSGNMNLRITLSLHFITRVRMIEKHKYVDQLIMWKVKTKIKGLKSQVLTYMSQNDKSNVTRNTLQINQ